MNARLMKETRDLLPIFAGMLLLIVVPFLIWGATAGDFGVVTFGVACVVMGGCSFGNEFQHRTLSLLLSQPIARSVMWRDKMLVLAAGIVANLAVLVVCRTLCSVAPGSAAPLVLALIALCAFCGGPFWALLQRHAIAGMALTAGAPAALLGVYALVSERFLGAKEFEPTGAVILMLLYCAVAYMLGYAQFKRLQAADTPARELSLPAGAEALFVRPLARITRPFAGPFASLLKKEFRLQQVSFLLAGLFCLIAAVGFCLLWLRSELAQAIVGCDYVVYMVILPLIAGAISVGEERGWGLAEWHLTLPPSGLQQWSAKMLAALSTGLGLGLLLPIALAAAGTAILGQILPKVSLAAIPITLCWLLGSLLATSIAVHAASASGNTLRAILVAMGIVAAACAVCIMVIRWAPEIATRWLSPPMYFPRVTEGQIGWLVAADLLFLLCLVQSFAWSNFRRFAPPARRIIAQTALLCFCIGILTLISFSLTLAPRFMGGN